MISILLFLSLTTTLFRASLAKKYEEVVVRFYEDSYVKLTDTDLVIKSYFLPCVPCAFAAKFIDVRNIKVGL